MDGSGSVLIAHVLPLNANANATLPSFVSYCPTATQLFVLAQ
jgi:hypothetical protein